MALTTPVVTDGSVPLARGADGDRGVADRQVGGGAEHRHREVVGVDGDHRRRRWAGRRRPARPRRSARRAARTMISVASTTSWALVSSSAVVAVHDAGRLGPCRQPVVTTRRTTGGPDLLGQGGHAPLAAHHGEETTGVIATFSTTRSPALGRQGAGEGEDPAAQRGADEARRSARSATSGPAPADRWAERRRADPRPSPARRQLGRVTPEPVVGGERGTVPTASSSASSSMDMGRKR